MGAFHGADVPFVFGAKFELKTAAERALSLAMGCYWRSFAMYGDPAHANCSSIGWPQYATPEEPVLILGTNVTVAATGGQDIRKRCSLVDDIQAVQGSRVGQARRSVQQFFVVPRLGK